MDTIFALSSGLLPSGIGVIRISGSKTRFAVETICNFLPQPRLASLGTFRHPGTGNEIDRGIVIWFPGPKSFTGEDCAEFHIHGGAAVVSLFYSILGDIEGFRIAEPGEFSRRTFENGKMDLTELEGLSDLISAQTEVQRDIAHRQHRGELRAIMEDWRDQIVRLRALVEADLDFSDEEDVPGSVADNVWQSAGRLAVDIGRYLDDNHRGEIIRDGFHIVILGKPNSGKSSLMNALAKRSVAIVSEEAGTTRDLIEVHLDLGGYAVTVVDTAGIREAKDKVETEGVRRALDRAARADLIVWLTSVDDEVEDIAGDYICPVIHLRSKDDEARFGISGVSVKRKDSLDELIDSVTKLVNTSLGRMESAPVTRERHRNLLSSCKSSLEKAEGQEDAPIEIRAEYLRDAGDKIGRITG
ncbi:MAG: tRNA uridine-5-carboxymethylaminomethyl(34) synthesis GTPase MnmE, partial [Rhizobiaceae bacterium]